MRWVKVNFQTQGNNKDAKHFSYNFITENTRYVLSFTLKLIDDENKEIKFDSSEEESKTIVYKKIRKDKEKERKNKTKKKEDKIFFWIPQ